MNDRQPPRLDGFGYRIAIPTRWSDNDLYGHANNVVYYAWFDTVANRFLIERCGLDIHDGDVIAVVAESGCRYHAPLAFPQTVHAALRVARLGRRSVTWEIGIFAEPAPVARAAAHGFFVHVFVDRRTRRPVEIPPPMRERIAALQTGPQ